MPAYTSDEVIFAEGPWVHRDVSANGARFHAAVVGEGPLVLLLHGFPTFWWTWRRLIPRIADAGFTAAAMDMRGYGGSDHPPRGYDLFTLTRDVSAVIRSLGFESATIIGQGIGGLLGWSTASLHSGSVNGLVAVAAPHPLRMRQALLGDRAQIQASAHMFGFQRPWVPERNLVADEAEAIEGLLRDWSADPAWPDSEIAARYRVAFQFSNTAHCALEYYRWGVRSLPRADGRRFAAEIEANPISAPVLQLHGSADQTLLPRTARGSAEFLTGPYAWRTITGAGHFPQEEQPEVVGGLVLDWLTATPRWSS
jgi:pimeloyl-ACP methyl ester carboxylesterase